MFYMSHRKHEMLVNENIYSRPDLEYNVSLHGNHYYMFNLRLNETFLSYSLFPFSMFQRVCFKISHMKCWLMKTYILDRISDVGLGFMATIMIIITFNLRLNETFFSCVMYVS